MVSNAYPRIEDRGTKDNSKRQVRYVPVGTPQFIPKIFIMNDRGPIDPRPVPGELLISLYGENLTNEDSKFFKHQNALFPAVYGNGSYAVVQRLVDPTVLNKKANVTIYLDILEDDINVYKRHSDGSYVYDDNGDPVVDSDNSPFKGYKVKWIAEVSDTSEEVGNKTVKTGTMADSKGNKSTMYPIFEERASDPGSFYNNLGFGFDAFTTAELSQDELIKYKTFPLKAAFYKRNDANSTPVLVRTKGDAPVIKFALKPNVVDPVTKRKLSLSTLPDEYYGKEEYREIEEPYVYKNYVEQVLGLLYSKEAQWRHKDIKTAEGTVNTDVWYDFLSDLPDDEQKWLLNPITFRTLSRVPYFGFVHDTSAVKLASNQKDLTMSKNLPVFLGGGEDGDISDAKYEELIRTEMEKYLDKDGPYFDPVINVESALVDTGFSFDTKKSLVNFITLRKDTFLFLSTYVYNKDNKPMELEEERSLGIALNNRCQLALESSYYNTPVMRAIIVSSSGIYERLPGKHRLPVTIDLVEKVAAMMGRPKWDKAALFDRGELDVIKSMVNIYPKSIPESLKENLWYNNIVYPQSIDRETYVFPALQTVYPYDNSALNNIFTVMAIVYTHKVAYEAQRRFSGNVSLSDSDFLAKVDAFINSKLSDAFAGMFVVTAKSTLTDDDAAKGYSWTTMVDIYSTVMKTVMEFGIGAYRRQ